jgi:hypothetical protein
MILQVYHESCQAEVLFDGTICSIQGIHSKTQGKGHATICIKKIEIIAKNKKMKEIWFPTVISPKLAKLLHNLGYIYTNFGPHPKLRDSPDVTGFRKILKK